MIEFSNFLLQLNKRSGEKSVSDISFYVGLYPVFSCEKALLNISYDRKEISEFSHTDL